MTDHIRRASAVSGLLAVILLAGCGRYEPVAGFYGAGVSRLYGDTCPVGADCTAPEGAPVLVDFYSDECPPCMELMPTIEKLAREYCRQVHFVKVNVRKAYPPMVARHNITDVPTVILLVDGQEEYRWEGPTDEAEYRKALKEVTGALVAMPDPLSSDLGDF